MTPFTSARSAPECSLRASPCSCSKLPGHRVEWSRGGRGAYGAVMLPPLNDEGYLPSGIHRCPVEELVARFGGGSDERVTQTAELLLFVEAARKAGVRRLLVNGSFVTGRLAPNDVDLVILPGPGYPRQGPALDSDELIWPLLQILVAADDADFEAWATHQFATDRKKRPKGVVEVIL
jgi:hypothetical protein